MIMAFEWGVVTYINLGIPENVLRSHMAKSDAPRAALVTKEDEVWVREAGPRSAHFKLNKSIAEGVILQIKWNLSLEDGHRTT